MFYQSTFARVEAERVLLSDKHLYVVDVKGIAYLVDGKLFELFFTLMPGKSALVEPKAHAKPTPAAANPVAVKQAAPKQAAGQRQVSAVAQRALKILNDFGPLTTAEFQDHVYPDIEPRKRVQNFSALSLDMRRRGLIARRECPTTRIDKWFVVEG